MISQNSMYLFIVAAVLTTLLPILLLVWLGIKQKLLAKPLLFGVLAFFVSQVMLRMPALSFIQSTAWYQDVATRYFWYTVLGLCFSAGLFEETARFIFGKTALKRELSYKAAISFGIGHAVCEVIFLVGMQFVNDIIYSVLINTGTINKMSMTQESINQIIAALNSVGIADILVSLWERTSAVFFHVFATVLIFYGIFKKRGVVSWLAAMAAHTLFNLAALALMKYSNIYITEAVLMVISLCGLYYVIAVRKHFNKELPAAVKI